MRNPTPLLLLSTLARATPLLKLPNASPFIKRDVLDTADGLCKGWDTTTADGAADLWEKTGAGVTLDLFIKTQWEHEHHWLKNLEDGIQGGKSGASGTAGCGDLESKCNPMDGLSCQGHFDRWPESITGKDAYWIFQAVLGMRGKFKQMTHLITKETLISGYSIDSMISEFQAPEVINTKVLAWLSAACTMGNAVGSVVPGVGSGMSAGFGILAGMFSGMAADEESVDPAAIEQALGDAFDKAITKLEDTLRISTGGGTSDDEYNSLPAPMWDTFESKVAKFFNGGWFLIDDDEDAVTFITNSLAANIKPRVANDVMSASGLRLVADRRDRSNTQEKCGNHVGRQWMDLRPGEPHCFYLMRNHKEVWVEAEDAVYSNMAKYSLGDRVSYYNALIDCALNGGSDKTVDTGKVTWGQIPTCYFNMPAYYIDETKDQDCGDPFGNSNCDPNIQATELTS